MLTTIPWIESAERLPELEVPVLGLLGGDTLCFAQRIEFDSGWYWTRLLDVENQKSYGFDDTYDYDTHDYDEEVLAANYVTHWHPIPSTWFPTRLSPLNHEVELTVEEKALLTRLYNWRTRSLILYPGAMFNFGIHNQAILKSLETKGYLTYQWIQEGAYTYEDGDQDYEKEEIRITLNPDKIEEDTV